MSKTQRVAQAVAPWGIVLIGFAAYYALMALVG